MKKSDTNHLRRLLGWVRCEIGQSPEELVATVNDIRAKIFPNGGISDEGKARTVAAYDAARKVPAYVRSSVKALEKALRPGEIVGDVVPEILAIDAPAVLPALDIVLIATEEYSDYSTKTYRILKPFTFGSALEKCTSEWDARREMVKKPDPDGFIKWLISMGYIEYYDCKEVHVGCYRTAEIDKEVADVEFFPAAKDAAELVTALSALVELYENDEGCRSLPEYKAAKAALSKVSVA